MDIIKNFFDFRINAASFEDINNDMHNNIKISIDNVMILSSAILIACIGLNVNSIPVIIGAMLISPIMGPLFTVAYSLVVEDSDLLKKALKRLFVYILVSLVISTIYFKLSFINNPTTELIARTNPTIFDILIAIFGGIAGIIGITRKEKTNIIPGVAIATALMPPLCTIGYGIANVNFTFVLNASILFITNAYFIIVTAIIVLYFMRLHKVGDLEEESENKIKRITLVVFGIILLVTMVNTSTLITKANVQGSLDTYVYENINDEGNIIVNTNIDYTNEVIKFTVTQKLTESQKDGLKEYIKTQKNISTFKILIVYEQMESI